MELASTEKTVQEMRSNGAVDEAIYRTRAAAVSVEAADRLAQLDQAEAAWKTRTNAFLAGRNRLLGGSGPVVSSEQSRALQQLRDASSTSDQQQRLTAYESPTVAQLR